MFKLTVFICSVAWGGCMELTDSAVKSFPNQTSCFQRGQEIATTARILMIKAAAGRRVPMRAMIKCEPLMISRRMIFR